MARGKRKSSEIRTDRRQVWGNARKLEFANLRLVLAYTT